MTESPRVTGIRPEAELLLCCARSRMNSENITCAKKICQENIDWEYLLRIAGRHGLMPLLYSHINAICSEAIPETILNKLKNHFNANAGSNLFLTGELLRLLNLFEAHGIPAVAYKGPVLASSVYGNLALREFVDLDILIHKKDVTKVKDLLRPLGYVPLFPLSPAQEAVYLQSQGQIHFVSEKSKVKLEILWEFVPSNFTFPLSLEHLWTRLNTVNFAGKEIQTFSPEDSILILCVHGFKHCWERIGWLCDIAELIRVNHNLDWNYVFEEAARLKSERMLFLGLHLAKDLLGVNLPDNVVRGIDVDSMVRSLASKVHEHLFRDVVNVFGIFERHLFFLKSMERLQDRFRYCFHIAMSPTPLEYELLTLPRSLFFLYYLIRPIRLLGKYSLSPIFRKMKWVSR